MVITISILIFWAALPMVHSPDAQMRVAVYRVCSRKLSRHYLDYFLYDRIPIYLVLVLV